ncbi:polysaccharide lyase family 4 protein [Amniculicola lignicola CBS 123094]|uniref:rhamnogalacturonan endolyase n=1 Tax=Amniculicola lignicola CBS 123094 TaxID=1392246 RepID=A0A6A5WW65_9PLEO|nr:polysaccharide lyase family 4 protein [Amniculicola lignicola CBS 123094]
MRFLQLLGFAAVALSAPLLEGRAKSKSFLKQINETTWVLGNSLWNVTQNRQYANKLFYKGQDRVGKAVGHYVSYNGAASDLNWTSAAIVDSGSDYINVKFTAKEGDFHWVIYDDLAGAYQYFVNHALPVLGEFRTLWRLDNSSFTKGRTYLKDGPLPPLSDYLAATKVQDETWQKADGTYLTKYDWSAVLRSTDYYGVYGDKVGSWYFNPGKDYYNGDQTKGELMVHRESLTGDTVQLNMIHGTHFQAIATDTFADGKTWGPWLWYLNDGSKTDAAARAEEEEAKWPYKWYEALDKAYRTRGRMQGQLALSDGRAAAGANVFLGDSNSTLSTLDQGANYYYTTTADKDGKFVIKDIRQGTYGLYAWSNGGKIGDVSTTFIKNDVVIREGDNTNLKKLSWPVTDLKKRIFQVGDFDRKSVGFLGSGGYFHGRIATCPANITYTIGKSKPSDWCFGQSSFGKYSITFSLASIPTTATGAKLTVSMAGFSTGSAADVLLNDVKVGRITNSATILSSQDTYRGATVSGEWHLLEMPIAKAQLKVGVNKVDFNVTASTLWRGWFWDSVVLDWQ